MGLATGAVAGLVAITPAAGTVGPMGAMAVGAVAGGLTYGAVRIRNRFRFDDALDVFAVHGVGGIWGALATAVFAVGGIGVIDGEFGLLWANARAVLAVTGYSLAATFVILKVLDVMPGFGLRANGEEENLGLDLSHHGERAYVADGAD